MFPRLSRTQYWVRFIVFSFFFFAIPLNINNALLGAITWTATLVFFLYASVCRCHDFDYSGLTLFWLLVPVANLVLLLMLLAKKGTAGPNTYDSYQVVSNTSNASIPLAEAVNTNNEPPAQNVYNSIQPESVVKIPSKKDRLHEALNTNHPYQDMLLHNKE